MKLFSSYLKEMKIAARGYYFYIEVFMAVLILLLLLFVVSENPQSKVKEFLYYDMSTEIKSNIIQSEIDKGSLKPMEPTDFKMKAVAFDLTNKETGEVKSYDFKEETYTLDTYQAYDLTTGELAKTIYVSASEEQTIRLAYQEKKVGATLAVNDKGESSFKYYNQGYETERYENLLYIIHNEDSGTVQAAYDKQEVTQLEKTELLNNRQNLIPVVVVLMGALLGLFMVMAYIFLDKDEGVISAFAVTPSPMWKYLLSKTLVILTTVTISSSIFTIPIMGAQPNYPLFYLLLLISSFAFSSLGLFISSFFDNISKAFGVLYIVVIAMALPAFSYFVPSFDPLWLRFFPTYPILQGMKEIMMVGTDVGYVLFYSGVFLVGGLALFVLANQRFKKSLTV